MASNIQNGGSRSLGHSSIPIKTPTQRRFATVPSVDSNIPNLVQRQPLKFEYANEDIQEFLPEHAAPPLFVVPHDDANILEVREYMFAVLTRAGWGLALDFPQEIRATLNNFYGKGWSLRKKYIENKLKDICPISMTVEEDGCTKEQNINDTVRSHIGNCLMREMERCFQLEEQQDAIRRVNESIRRPISTVGNARVVKNLHMPSREEDFNTTKDVKKQNRPMSRGSLPDEWMTESLRGRTASRQSQSKDTRVIRQPSVRNNLHLFVNKESSWPMLMDIVSGPENQRKDKSVGRDSTFARERKASYHARKPTVSPYQTIRDSFLPRPTASYGKSSLPPYTSGSDSLSVRTDSPVEQAQKEDEENGEEEEPQEEQLAEEDLVEEEPEEENLGESEPVEAEPVEAEPEEVGEEDLVKEELVEEEPVEKELIKEEPIGEEIKEKEDVIVVEVLSKPVSIANSIIQSDSQSIEDTSESRKDSENGETDDVPMRPGMLEELEQNQNTHEPVTPLKEATAAYPEPVEARSIPRIVISEDPDAITPAPPRYPIQAPYLPYQFTTQTHEEAAEAGTRYQEQVNVEKSKFFDISGTTPPSVEGAQPKSTEPQAPLKKKRHFLKRLWKKIKGGKSKTQKAVVQYRLEGRYYQNAS